MKRRALVLAGHGFLILGIIGAFLPVMPTVVFLILAAACYGRGNPALHRKLLEHPRFGPPLRDWETHRAMSVRAKVVAIVMVALGITVSAIWVVERTWIRALLIATGIGIVGLILALRTRR